MSALSPKQKKIVEFVRRFWRDRGYPPTVRDIVSGCEISSTSVVDYNLDILAREGYIRRHSGISRGIELLARRSPLKRDLEVPIVGQIAAGAPIPVPAPDTWDVTGSADTVVVTEDMLRGKKDVYALRVKGSSMVDALINDGDVVLMEYTNAVENGQMAAVWLKAEKEVTLKKVYRESGRIRLQPANSRMKAIFADPDNVQIQGRVVAVIRRLA